MSAAAIDMLAAVRALGGEVKLADSGRLKVIAPAPLPNQLIEQLREAKPDLLTLLAPPEPQTEPLDTWADTEGGTRRDPRARRRRTARLGRRLCATQSEQAAGRCAAAALAALH
jgi:hypothetical protein